MSDAQRFTRPATPEGFDSSRAAERAADPRGWRYAQDARDAVHRVIAERRDMRRFRPDPVSDDVLRRVLEAAHRAPSVGLMQPWRLIVVRSLDTRVAVRRLAQRERLRQAERFDERARQFLDQKIEGIVEAPLGVCVCCDHGDPASRSSGAARSPRPTCTAPRARSRTCGSPRAPRGSAWAGSASTARRTCARCSGIPGRVDPIAYLCVGWPDERPCARPRGRGLVGARRAEEVVMDERWREDGARPAGSTGARRPGSCRLGPDGPAPDRAARRSRRATGSISWSSRLGASARSSR